MPTGTGPTRTAAQRERDLLTLAERYCRGEPQSVIAAALGVSQQIVSRDLHVLYRRWQEQAADRMERATARELAKLDHLERAYWASFEASQVGDSEDDPLPGNPAYLAGVERCIDRRIKLMGLDAPTRLDIQGPLRAWAASEGLDPDEVASMGSHLVREYAGREN